VKPVSGAARNRLLREKTLCPLAQRQPDNLRWRCAY